MNISYPVEFLKGLPNDHFVDDEGNLTAESFLFKKRDNAPERPDGYREESINWHDDEGALESLFTQKKDGHIQFKRGVAVLSRSEYENLKHNPNINNSLSYERRELQENPYHGNLLLSQDVPDLKRKMIASTIALLCKTSIKPNPYK